MRTLPIKPRRISPKSEKKPEARTKIPLVPQERFTQQEPPAGPGSGPQDVGCGRQEGSFRERGAWEKSRCRVEKGRGDRTVSTVSGGRKGAFPFS